MNEVDRTPPQQQSPTGTTAAVAHVARLQQRDRILGLRAEAELVMERLAELARREIVRGVAVERVEEPIDRLARLRSMT